MKIFMIGTLCAMALISSAALARPMSQMEWMDPKALEIWRSLSETEKVESVKVIQNSGAMGGSKTARPYQDELNSKVKTCIDREAADPEYQGINVPIYMPMMYCWSKYDAILQAKFKKQK